MDYPDHTPYGICTCDACEKNQLRQRVAELGKERDALKQQRDELVVAATKAAEEIRKCDYTPARSTLLVAIASIKEKS